MTMPIANVDLTARSRYPAMIGVGSSSVAEPVVGDERDYRGGDFVPAGPGVSLAGSTALRNRAAPLVWRRWPGPSASGRITVGWIPRARSREAADQQTGHACLLLLRRSCSQGRPTCGPVCRFHRPPPQGPISSAPRASSARIGAAVVTAWMPSTLASSITSTISSVVPPWSRAFSICSFRPFT